MLKIWGRTSSTNVQKVMWAVAELGLAHTRVDAGMQYGVVNDPAYRALNPNGRVPTIEDGSFVMWESNACVRYLYAKYGPPQTPEQRGAGDKWMDWSATTLADPSRDLFWSYIRTAPEKRDATLIENARRKAAPRSAWATFPSAARRTAGSRCRSSGPTCRTSPPGTGGCASGRRSGST
jgi:glutathione S-transferase